MNFMKRKSPTIPSQTKIILTFNSFLDNEDLIYKDRDNCLFVSLSLMEVIRLQTQELLTLHPNSRIIPAHQENRIEKPFSVEVTSEGPNSSKSESDPRPS